jgi:hypothetical protein
VITNGRLRQVSGQVTGDALLRVEQTAGWDAVFMPAGSAAYRRPDAARGKGDDDE